MLSWFILDKSIKDSCNWTPLSTNGSQKYLKYLKSTLCTLCILNTFYALKIINPHFTKPFSNPFTFIFDENKNLRSPLIQDQGKLSKTSEVKCHPRVFFKITFLKKVFRI